MRRYLSLTCAVAAAGVLGAPSPGFAQRQETVSMIRDTGVHRRPVDMSLLGGAPGFGLAGIGGGVRVAIPILHDGFLPTMNDGVFVETGAEFIHWTFLDDAYNSITVPVHLRWNFYLDREWTAFAAAGLEFSYFLGESFFDPPSNASFFSVAQGGVMTLGLGGGFLYNLSEAMSLRVEVSLSMLGAGLTFRF